MPLGWAFTVVPETIVIASGLKVLSDAPFAVAPEKLTVPKFVRGRTPLRLEGASAITSAEASAAWFSRWVVVKVHGSDVSEIVSVNRPTPSVVTDAENVSPGLTGF